MMIFTKINSIFDWPIKEYVTEYKIASLFSIQSISEDAQNHTQSFVS